ncbi:MAG: SGNH/GDSL hydrolase family protein [Oscillospiraceae bacterium]|nr:SGNH/GDSL hydrolase family protein [Oscillospiraceae bacterium]
MKKRSYAMIPVCALAVFAGWNIYCGYKWGRGPFRELHDIKVSKLKGNAEKYAPENVRQLETSPLEGKHILFLGSSVTYGAASKGVSFADYIALRDRCRITKEAVSGTTLVDTKEDSYISRMKKLDGNMAVDMFVCQLSTNDATRKKPLGNISENGEYDTSTVAGAIEFIIDYARETWHCPIVFYTNPKYESSEYAAMVELLGEIAKVKDISVIDLWNDEHFNSITDGQRALFMADQIHPTQAGYLEWWTPKMEDRLYEVTRE